MKYRVLLGLLACLCLNTQVMAAGQEKQAEAAALQWLDLVDAGQYEASWQEAADVFRQQIDADQWAQAIGAVRKPLGRLKFRRLKEARHMTDMPGVPKGEYVVLTFEAIYEHQPQAIETVTPMMDVDGWRVSGYYIR